MGRQGPHGVQVNADPQARNALRLAAGSLLTPEDDNFHAPLSTDWWEHETAWFWFFEPQRKLGCWIYHYARANIGVCGGGVFLFDDSTWNYLEAPYYLNYSNMALPKERDLRRFRFANGFEIEALEPLTRYRLRYKDRDAIRFDLDWRAVMKPWADQRGDPPALWHFDQFGRVTGELVLHGERIEIDCIAMRDRSWRHLRPEPWKDGWGGGGYVTAAASPETAFFGAGPGGFLVLDGELSPLVSGSVVRERDPTHGFIRRIVVEGKDDRGRTFIADGDAVSRMAMPISGCQGVCWTSLVRYAINGMPAWGDDQDAWPLQNWAAMRRSAQGLPDVRAARAETARSPFE